MNTLANDLPTFATAQSTHLGADVQPFSGMATILSTAVLRGLSISAIYAETVPRVHFTMLFPISSKALSGLLDVVELDARKVVGVLKKLSSALPGVGA